MTPETVLSTGQHALEITIVLILVMLIPALAVGLLVSMFQDSDITVFSGRRVTAVTPGDHP